MDHWTLHSRPTVDPQNRCPRSTPRDTTKPAKCCSDTLVRHTRVMGAIPIACSTETKKGAQSCSRSRSTSRRSKPRKLNPFPTHLKLQTRRAATPGSWMTGRTQASLGAGRQDRRRARCRVLRELRERAAGAQAHAARARCLGLDGRGYDRRREPDAAGCECSNVTRDRGNRARPHVRWLLDVADSAHHLTASAAG